MKSARFLSLAFLILIFAFSTLLYADVPQMINYQGKLTTPEGALIDDTVSMVFTIYVFSGIWIPVWAETLAVVVENGSYATLLGSVHPIPYELFDGTVRYLGVKAGDDSEMTPRKEIVSTPYAYRAATAATVQSGGFPCADCDDRFVNSVGPDSIIAASDTGFFVKTAGSSGEDGYVLGILGYSENSTLSGGAIGGQFVSYSSNGGAWYWGVYAKADCHDSPCLRANGLRGYARNSSDGEGVGGSFSTFTETGDAWGVTAQARATVDGTAIGGEFSATWEGAGTHYGVWSSGEGSSSSPTYGTYSEAQNISSGDVYGGWFHADSGGTGKHYGLRAEAYSNFQNSVIGIYSKADNTSSGEVCAGWFYTSGLGTGKRYALKAQAYGQTSQRVHGIYGSARNNSSGNAYGGYFSTFGGGTGTRYGIYSITSPSDGYAGYFYGDVYITDSLVVSGAKSAAVKMDNGEYRLLYSQESPEVWFEDFGEGQLVGDRAHIELDPLFLQTVTINTENPIKVFIQLTSGNPMNIVVNKGTTGFDVVAQDVNSSASFDYRVVAKRKGFENIRLAKMGGPTPEEVDAEQIRMEAEKTGL